MTALLFAALLLQGASQADQPCVILKRMGPADEVTSRMYSFGIRGKQFQYLEGELPKGVKFHGRLTDNDVRKIQDAGGKVMVVESHYTETQLQDARKRCAGASSETPAPAAQPTAAPAPAPASQPTEKPPAAALTAPPAAQPTAPPTPAPASQPAEKPPAAPPTPPAAPAAASSAPTPGTAPTAEDLCTVVVKSTPDGADITVDGNFVGNTPSTLRLAPGDHTILIEKSGMKSWQRTMTVSPGGNVTIDAKLEQAQ